MSWNTYIFREPDMRSQFLVKLQDGVLYGLGNGMLGLDVFGSLSSLILKRHSNSSDRDGVRRYMRPATRQPCSPVAAFCFPSFSGAHHSGSVDASVLNLRIGWNRTRSSDRFKANISNFLCQLSPWTTKRTTMSHNGFSFRETDSSCVFFNENRLRARVTLRVIAVIEIPV